MKKEYVPFIFMSFFAIMSLVFGCNDVQRPALCHFVSSTQWYTSQVQVNYQNGSVDTIAIDIYERPDNITIENGNLSYWKPTGKTGGTVAYVVHLASYVRSFKILKAEYKHKTE